MSLLCRSSSSMSQITIASNSQVKIPSIVTKLINFICIMNTDKVVNGAERRGYMCLYCHVVFGRVCQDDKALFKDAKYPFNSIPCRCMPEIVQLLSVGRSVQLEVSWVVYSDFGYKNHTLQMHSPILQDNSEHFDMEPIVHCTQQI